MPKFDWGMPLTETGPTNPFSHPFWKRHPDLQKAIEWAAIGAGAKIAWRTIVTNPTAFAIVLLVPTIAVTAGTLTVAGIELVVGKKEAKELVEWYSLTVNIWNDPYAWHVETDRVVQGAAEHIIEGLVPGLLGVPGELSKVKQPIQEEVIQTAIWAHWKFWKSDQAQSAWGSVGEGIGGGGSW